MARGYPKDGRQPGTHIPAPKEQILKSFIGRRCLCRIENKGQHVWVWSTIVRYRRAFGRYEVEVAPVHGEGTVWVSFKRIRWDPVPQDIGKK